MTNHKWTDFEFVDIFDIRKGFYNKKPPCYDDGNIPFIGATDSKNGITGFSDLPTIEANSKVGYGPNESIDRKLFPGNAICVTNNGSVGYAYYQPTVFTCTHDVNPLYLKHVTLNRHIAMFLIACIEKQRVCFTYARKWRPKRMVHSKLMLPITSDGQPDWQFMEDFMRQKEQQILKPTIDKLCKQLIFNQIGGGCLLNHKWKVFDFTDVFTDIQRGKRLKKADHTEGDTPYVSSTSQTNGVDGFVGNTSGVRTFADCLTVANSGSVGSAFYHRYRFVASDHVTKLQREGLDKFAYLFMVPIINRLSEKYSFNREINDERIKREKLLLPVNDNDEIDFVFMSAFMREVENDILKTTLAYFADIQSITPPCQIHCKSVSYKDFFIQEIADILSGHDIYERERIDGQIPYITATANNNGIGYFVANTNETLEENCLSVNRNGSVGYCHYHPYKALYGNDTRKLRPHVPNKYISLYISEAISSQRCKYGYGYKMGTGRLKRQKIMLPVTPDGNPDWEYMEAYMRGIESKALLTAIKHFANRFSEHISA